MFSAASISRFAGLVSQARFASFPCRMTFRGQPVTGTCTSTKTATKLQEFGFMSSHDAIARIPLTAAPGGLSKTGEHITVFMPTLPVAGQEMRIDEILAHPTNPEYRLGLGCL